MIGTIAWKNVWRNKKRSLVVISAVTLGIISGVLLVGIMEGWVGQRLKDAVNNEVSHVQIHNNDYLNNEETSLTVENLQAVTRAVESLNQVSGWVQRSRIIALINTPWGNTGLTLFGIDPEREKLVTGIHDKIVPGAGRYPEEDSPADILISDKTADMLKLKQYVISDSVMATLGKDVSQDILSRLETIKDTRYRSPKEIRATLKNLLTGKELDRYGKRIMETALDYRIRNKVQVSVSDLDGNPIQGIFRVCGIYKTTNTGFDQATAFVNAGELARLYGGDEVLIHEIAVLLKNIEDAGAVKEQLSLIPGGNKVRTWKELAPDAAMMVEFMLVYYVIFIGIIMLALAFGIINTMLMSVLERTKELGMLMSIGMNHKRIFSMIMLETMFLTIVGAITGMLSGWGITSALGKTGIHFSGWGEGFEAIGYSARVYPAVTLEFILFTTIMVVVTAVVSSMWPARKALKMNPVDALRTD